VRLPEYVKCDQREGIQAGEKKKRNDIGKETEERPVDKGVLRVATESIITAVKKLPK
jgi:hypothetical protein